MNKRPAKKAPYLLIGSPPSSRLNKSEHAIDTVQFNSQRKLREREEQMSFKGGVEVERLQPHSDERLDEASVNLPSDNIEEIGAEND